VSARAAGLRDDTRLGKQLKAPALETIRVPTLAISARDDAFGTYAAAAYIAGRISNARFVGFDSGGHLLVGHGQAVLRTPCCPARVCVGSRWTSAAPARPSPMAS
jgi:2-hydroxy-6-oxonona-2,4-dienedioate hydrolase